MAKSINYKKALDAIDILSKSEFDSLVRNLMKKLGVAESKDAESSFKGTRCDELINEDASHKPNCPHCGAKADFGYIVKNGIHRGAQRYKCKSCEKKFVSTTKTAFSRTHKNAETWRKFIELTLTQKSLAACAEECNICIQTAFTWRHKVLNVFSVNQDKIMMSGKVEVDELLIPISYKGNHMQGSFGKRERRCGEDNNLPRKSYHRGTDNKSRSSKEKACIFCMVENDNKNFFASVPGVGFMTDAMLNATVAKHVNKENSMLLADDYKVTKLYFEKNGYKYMILHSNTSDNPAEHKPEVRDGFHLQHVNSMHQHIRNFLKPYYGVSTKYLSNYIALFVWLKSVGQMKTRKKADKISIARAATPDCYVTYKELHNRPAVPQCA